MAFYANNTDVNFHSMFTLTYKTELAPLSGKELKKNLNAFLSWLRSVHHGFEYLWFLEFTRAGTPHVHILANVKVPEPLIRTRRGSIQNMLKTAELSKRWSAITGNSGSAMDRVSVSWEQVRTKNGAARYATKYAYKTEQKQVPPTFQDVGRFWGNSKKVKPTAILTESIDKSIMSETGFNCTEDFDGNKRPYRIQFGLGLDRVNNDFFKKPTA